MPRLLGGVCAETRPGPYAFGVVLTGGTSTTAAFIGRHRASTPRLVGVGTRTAGWGRSPRHAVGS